MGAPGSLLQAHLPAHFWDSPSCAVGGGRGWAEGSGAVPGPAESCRRCSGGRLGGSELVREAGKAMPLWLRSASAVSGAHVQGGRLCPAGRVLPAGVAFRVAAADAGGKAVPTRPPSQPAHEGHPGEADGSTRAPAVGLPPSHPREVPLPAPLNPLRASAWPRAAGVT